jgi:hypothetical protein
VKYTFAFVFLIQKFPLVSIINLSRECILLKSTSYKLFLPNLFFLSVFLKNSETFLYSHQFSTLRNFIDAFGPFSIPQTSTFQDQLLCLRSRQNQQKITIQRKQELKKHFQSLILLVSFKRVSFQLLYHLL